MKRSFLLNRWNLFTLTVVSLFLPAADGASHLWRFNELFSNADGTIQFIELKECCGATAENFIQNKWIEEVGSGHLYTFPSNIVGNTANKHLLLATAGFAALPGAPTPDYIIPDGFLPVSQSRDATANSGVLEYWFYPDATWAYPNVPVDGVSSLNRNGTIGFNTPTNFAGETSTVNVSGITAPATSTATFMIAAIALLIVGAFVFRLPRTRHALTGCGPSNP